MSELVHSSTLLLTRKAPCLPSRQDKIHSGSNRLTNQDFSGYTSTADDHRIPADESVYATIWQIDSETHCKASWQQDDQPSIEQVEESCSFIGQKNGHDDWHIVCLDDLPSCSDPNDNDLEKPLWYRFSVPICQGKRRYLRCSEEQLLDLAHWLIWQRTEYAEIPCSLTFNPPTRSGTLSMAVERQCRGGLFELLDTCNTWQLPYILRGLYCVATSFRPMLLSEFFAAVMTVTESDARERGENLNHLPSPDSEYEMLSICQSVLQLDSDQRVVFRLPFMRDYLLQVQLPGLAHGHSTMSKICLHHLKDFGAAMVVTPWLNFRRWFRKGKNWPLFRYVASYWDQHYRLAESESAGLSATLHKMIAEVWTSAEARRNPNFLSFEVQRQVVDIGLALSQIYGFRALAETYRHMGALNNESKQAILGCLPNGRQWNMMRPSYALSASRAPMKLGNMRYSLCPMEYDKLVSAKTEHFKLKQGKNSSLRKGTTAPHRHNSGSTIELKSDSIEDDQKPDEMKTSHGRVLLLESDETEAIRSQLLNLHINKATIVGDCSVLWTDEDWVRVIDSQPTNTVGYDNTAFLNVDPEADFDDFDTWEKIEPMNMDV